MSGHPDTWLPGRAAGAVALFVAAVLVAAVLLAGCGGDSEPAPKPTARATFSIALTDYCGTLESLRDANAHPPPPRDVARTLGQRLEVLERAYDHLERLETDRTDKAAYRAVVRDLGTARGALETTGGDLSNEGVLLALAQMRDTLARSFATLDPTLRRRCGMTAEELAGTPLDPPTTPGSGRA
ncbi:MAG: hypothetical protein NTV28_05580 [Propionibacteriales bacterium]|nr:hypothetical protein [Propionibacteriales bacterium]